MHTRRAHTSQGFTLIELMIVVAIIGVLASVAIPGFQRFQLRSKAGEARLILPAIRTAQGSYFGEYGTFVPVAPTPGLLGSASSIKVSWPVCVPPVTLLSRGNCIIGLAPEGPTYYNYAVATQAGIGGGAAPNVSYFADAESDVDGNRIFNHWGLRVPEQAGAAPPAALLGCAGVVDGATGNSIDNQIGPCGAGMGIVVF